MRIVEALESRGLPVRETDDSAKCSCPAHSDRRPSMNIRSIEGSVLLYCHAGCSPGEIVEALDLSLGDLFDDADGYTYVYPGGREVRRTPDKKFLQFGDKDDPSLFHADLITADEVFVPEGEKCCLAIESAGGQAVTTPGGASVNPARFDWSPLLGKRVKIIADQDAPGLKRAHRLLEFLEPIASHVAIYHPAKGKDAADHIAAGYTLAQFKPDLPSDVLSLSDAFNTWREWVESEQSEPIKTPWHQLNSKLAGGLHKGRVYVVAGRPGGGKSVIAQNAATHAATNGHRTLVISVEMPLPEIISRIVAAEARVDYKHITQREFDDNQVRIDQFIQTARSFPLFLCDNATISIEQIGARARALKEADGLDLLLIDYAQLLTPSDKRVSREQQVAHIARQAKILAMDLDIAVLLLAQLNRNAAEDDRVPRVSDLRESGELEQSADVIMLLYQLQNSPSLNISIGKNRTGPPASVSLTRRFDQARVD